MATIFLCLLAFFSVSYGMDPIQNKLLKQINVCDCHFESVVVSKGVQAGKVKCQCPSHDIAGIHVACANKSEKKLKNVHECASDQSIKIESQDALEDTKSPMNKQTKERSDAHEAQVR